MNKLIVPKIVMLQNPNVPYPLHNSPPIVSFLSQINPVHTLLSNVFRTPGLLSGLLPLDFPRKILYVLLVLKLIIIQLVIPATSWMHYTTSCNTHSSAPEDGQNNCPKHVELTGIINKPLLLYLVGCLYYLYFIILFLDLLNNLN